MGLPVSLAMHAGKGVRDASVSRAVRSRQFRKNINLAGME